MKNLCLFIAAVFTVAAIMIAMEMSGEQPDYQAYTKPKSILEDIK